MRAVDERDRTLPGSRQDRLPCFRMRIELASVASTKLVPFVRIVAEPPAQLGAGADLFQPSVSAQLFLGDAAWPQALDEEAGSIRARNRVVRSLQCDHSPPPVVRPFPRFATFRRSLSLIRCNRTDF